MTHDQQAYERYIVYCKRLEIKPTDSLTYFKVTSPLTAMPQMPKKSASHQPQKD